jgi:hypothetical protein
MDFDEGLATLGFRLSDERRKGGLRAYSAAPNRFLTYWVHAFEDGTALFTWEFAIGDFLNEHGLQIGSNETLNTFMFPSVDERGEQDTAWLAAAVERAEGQLASLDFARP